MRLCSIEGCGKPLKARGFCDAHWCRWRKHGSPHITLRPTYGEGKDPVKSREAKQRYRDRNREALREKGREYSKKNQARSKLLKRIAKKQKPDLFLQYNRKYYQDHKAETLERGCEWRAKNPERARENVRRRRKRIGGGKHHLRDGEWRALLNLYGHRCAYCLKRKRLEQDHVHPLSRGGLHNVGNVVPACVGCNRSKGTKLLSEWVRA